MQIATLNYHYNPKDNFHSNSISKFQQRHILTTIKNPEKKSKLRRSFEPNISTNSNASLPPIKTIGARPNSIRIKGNGIISSKFNDSSTYSFHQIPRSSSRQSDKSDLPGTRSRSITPSSKLVRLKFGYPVTIRSSDFYGPDLTESELRFREDSFVNDSIRSAHQTFRSSVIPQYEALDDPNLRRFFQSPLVSNVLRKTLNVDLSERLPKQRSKNRDGDYNRIVAKHSSGYGKLNGYDCLPPHARPHQHQHPRHQSSANSSLASFQTQQKKKLTPMATSSPIRNRTVTSSDIIAASSVSQD